jgi:hypothetical protein
MLDLYQATKDIIHAEVTLPIKDMKTGEIVDHQKLHLGGGFTEFQEVIKSEQEMIALKYYPREAIFGICDKEKFTPNPHFNRDLLEKDSYDLILDRLQKPISESHTPI